MLRGQCCGWSPPSPRAGVVGEDGLAAACVARCRAALAVAFALPAALLRWRRPPPGAGAVGLGDEEVEPGQAGAGGSSLTSSLAIILPFLVVNVREAQPPVSFVCRSNFSSSPFILCPESEQKKWQSPKHTSFHFRGFSIHFCIWLMQF